MEILVNRELRGGNVMQQRTLRGMSFVAVAVLLGTYLAQAQNQGGVPAEFKPTIAQKVDARSSPAKVTGEEESALTTKGYVKIGTVSAAQPSTKTDAEVTRQMESAILQKAAEAGGDVVRFSKEGKIETTYVPTGQTKTKRKCEEFKTNSITTGQNCTPSCHTDSAGNTMCINTLCSPKTMDVTVCVRWGEAEETPVTKRENSLVSEGTVWRYDLKLVADIAWARAAAIDSIPKEEVNGVDKEGRTQLGRAASEGSLNDVKLLLARGADVNAKDKWGETALYDAACMGNKEVTELLLAHGADVDAKDMTEETPLSCAADKGKGDLGVLELLLAHGADVNAKSGAALIGAACRGSRDIVEFLLAHGADINAKNSFVGTAMAFAASKSCKQKAMVDLLRQHGGHK